MNMAWDKFKPCPPLKELIPKVKAHEETKAYYGELKSKVYGPIAKLLQETSDTKYSAEELDGRKIGAIYDSFNSDKFHGLPHLNLTDEQVALLQDAKLFGLYEGRFKFWEQQKFALFNILETLSKELRSKTVQQDDEQSLKFLGFFGHDTNIQNFYKLYIRDKGKLMMNKHRIPEFAATLSWELYEIEGTQEGSEGDD